MKVFRAKGTFRMGREWQKFTKEIIDESDEGAREKVLSILGSKHRVMRTNIDIDEITEISPDEAEDTVIKGILEMEAN